MSTGLSVGLLLLRVGLAVLLAGHACQKLFGWFRGLGPSGHGAIFDQWGFRPGRDMAILAGVCELVGAASLALGLLMPGGCAVVIGTMLVAATPNARNGLWAHLGGSEVPVVYAGLGVVLALTGPGRFSLDRAFGLQALRDIGWSVAAIAVGALAAVPPLARRRAALRRTPTPT
ncbi:MAG TPA: DoxX family protein [Micromonosporaceae bacterium]|jgi:putative oxidoreductase